MAQTRTAFKDLNLKDAFLFSAALGDLETCQLVLELILGTKIKLASVKAESSILYSSDARSIRLDIYADDEMQVGYDIEMQRANEYNLPKRSRYHQAEMDLSSLKPGEDFNNLKPCFVVFICTFDPFGKGLYRYTFEERCLEHEMALGDETKKIFLNTRGKNQKDVPEELVHFLKYVEQTTDELAETANSPALQELHSKIKTLKKSREWEARYVTLGEYMDQEIKRGRQEAIEEEVAKAVEAEVAKAVEAEVAKAVEAEVAKAVEAEVAKAVEIAVVKTQEEDCALFLTLASRMIQDGNAEEVLQLQNDKAFLSEMISKYNL